MNAYISSTLAVLVVASMPMLRAQPKLKDKDIGLVNDIENIFARASLALQRDDYLKAYELFSQGVESGHKPSVAQLGYMHLHGLGCEKDEAKAIELFNDAGVEGYYHLGNMFQHGLAGVNRDVKKAVSYYEMAAKGGNAPSVTCLVRIYTGVELGMPDYDKMLAWLKFGESQGYHTCLSDLGDVYKKGVGVDKNLKKAISYYEKSIELGSDTARSSLGLLYLMEEEPVRDYDKALNLFKDAMESGEITGVTNLANMYYLGMGCERDPNKAFSLLEKAASEGNEHASRMLNRLKASDDIFE